MPNINLTRHIQDSPSANANEFTFSMPANVTIGCGVTSVVIGLDDNENEMEVEVSFAFDNTKQNFIDNCYVVVGDIVFDTWVDLGDGLPLGDAVPLGTEQNADLDIDNFLATQTIEVRWL